MPCRPTRCGVSPANWKAGSRQRASQPLRQRQTPKNLRLTWRAARVWSVASKARHAPRPTWARTRSIWKASGVSSRAVPEPRPNLDSRSASPRPIRRPNPWTGLGTGQTSRKQNQHCYQGRARRFRQSASPKDPAFPANPLQPWWTAPGGIAISENAGSGAHKWSRVSDTENSKSAPWQSGRSAIGDSRQTRHDPQGRSPQRLTGGPMKVDKWLNEAKTPMM